MSGTVEARLAQLGLDVPTAPTPAANYIPWVRTGAGTGGRGPTASAAVAP